MIPTGLLVEQMKKKLFFSGAALTPITQNETECWTQEGLDYVLQVLDMCKRNNTTSSSLEACAFTHRIQYINNVFHSQCILTSTVQLSSPTSLLAVHLQTPVLSLVKFFKVTISGFFKSDRTNKEKTAIQCILVLYCSFKQTVMKYIFVLLI